MAGRKAMPIELMLVKGKKNLTKKEIEERREAEANLKPNSNKVRPPVWLGERAKKEFKNLAAELNEIGIISNVDVNQLAVYCRAYVRYVDLQKSDNPDEKVLDTLYKQMKSMASEFGFTPSSRAKLAMPKKEEKEPNEFEKAFGDL